MEYKSPYLREYFPSVCEISGNMGGAGRTFRKSSYKIPWKKPDYTLNFVECAIDVKTEIC